MENLFVGIDSSTQSTKLIVVNYDSSEIIYIDSVQYDVDLPHYGTKNGVIQGLGEGVSESDPLMWIEALDILLDRLKKSSVPQNKVKAISVSGQQHGLVTLDEQGYLTRARSKLWNDFSTEKECAILTEKIGGVDAMIREVGNSQRTGYTAAKIFHMARHEPDAFQKTTTVFLVHNFINWYLTGGMDGGIRVMEPGDTSGMALWHPGTGTWSEKVLNAISEELSKKIPMIKPSDQSIGLVGKRFAERFGLDPECKVDAGCGDNMYGAVGTGNVKSGIVTISLGTSGTAYTYLKEPFIDPQGEIAAFCDSTGFHLPLLCVSNLANGYNAVLEHFSMTHDEFNDVAQQVPVGNEGRLLIPWYMGERTPDVPQASPVYFGFGIDDFTKEILSRAVLEGHILNLYDGFRKMPVKPNEIRLTGGLAQSELWCQTIADVFETETVPVAGEGAALGAALHAAWVYKKESGDNMKLDDIVQPFVILNEKKRKKPKAKNMEKHRIQKDMFKALSERARGQSALQDPFALRIQLIKNI